MNVANLKTCARCLKRQETPAGKLACSLTGWGIEVHANGRGCPEKKFPPVLLGEVPADYDPADYAKDSGGSEGCNCGGE